MKITGDFRYKNFFCSIIPTDDSNPYLSLLQVGYDNCKPGYSYSNYRDMYIIHFIKSGCGTLETKDLIYNLEANQAFIVRPNVLSVHTADYDNPWSYCFFAFKGDLAKKLIEKTAFKDNKIVISTENEAIFQTISDIAKEIYSNQPSLIELEFYLFKMLSLFKVNDDKIEANMIINEHHRMVHTVKQYISLNYSKSLRVKDIAEHFNINRSHLYRIFIEVTGKSIEEYLISVRINEARRLLDDTNTSIARISKLIGYSYSSTFCKTFKEYVGMTPQEYRTRNHH